jgi:hypothetical protein
MESDSDQHMFSIAAWQYNKGATKSQDRVTENAYGPRSMKSIKSNETQRNSVDTHQNLGNLMGSYEQHI